MTWCFDYGEVLVLEVNDAIRFRETLSSYVEEFSVSHRNPIPPMADILRKTLLVAVRSYIHTERLRD